MPMCSFGSLPISGLFGALTVFCVCAEGELNDVQLLDMGHGASIGDEAVRAWGSVEQAAKAVRIPQLTSTANHNIRAQLKWALTLQSTIRCLNWTPLIVGLYRRSFCTLSLMMTAATMTVRICLVVSVQSDAVCWQQSKLTGARDTEGWGGFDDGGFGGFGGQLVQLPDGRVIPRALLMQLLHAQQEQDRAEEDGEDDEQGGQGCRNQ